MRPPIDAKQYMFYTRTLQLDPIFPAFEKRHGMLMSYKIFEGVLVTFFAAK
jgi:hypothetical protein